MPLSVIYFFFLSNIILCIWKLQNILSQSGLGYLCRFSTQWADAFMVAKITREYWTAETMESAYNQAGAHPQSMKPQAASHMQYLLLHVARKTQASVTAQAADTSWQTGRLAIKIQEQTLAEKIVFAPGNCEVKLEWVWWLDGR